MPSARRRRIAIWSLALIALALVAAFALFQISNARCFALSGEAICRVETNEPLVALTFDDGPTEEGVAAALAALRPSDGRATFFLIGREVERRSPLIRQLLAEGHEVGNHSYSHQRMVAGSAGFYDDEIERTDALLRASGVTEPGLFRPPYGKKLWGLPLSLARHNYRMIMWDVEDPRGATTPEAYVEGILSQARPGSIILMHVMYRSNRVARDALPLVVRGLTARGFRIVTVGELLRARPPG